MTRLYLTRHGQTEWNLQHRMQGWKDSNLTEMGRQHAALLGERLKDVPFEIIYSSSSQRALQTAELVRGKKNIPIVAQEKLREINMGAWEGREIPEIKKEEKTRFDAFWNTPHLYQADTGESYQQVYDRAVSAINDIIHTHKGQNILVVSHAVTIKLILSHFEKRPFERLWDPPFMHGTSLSMIEIGEAGHEILLYGDIAHVPEQDIK